MPSSLNIMFGFVLLATALTGCSKRSTEIIAHRGASYSAPENTLASVIQAWELGADAVEVDIYLTPDNRIVIIHDADTERTAGVKHAVAETPSDVLRQLDVGSWKSSDYRGEKIPYLDEVLDTIPAGRRLIIEIKCGPEVIPRLVEVLNNSGKMDQVAIISFNFRACEQVKPLVPRIPVYYLCSVPETDEERRELTTRIKSAGIDGLDIQYKGIDDAFIRMARGADLDLYVWTVNDPVIAQQMTQAGVDGITTDRPGWLRENMSGR